MILPQIEDVPRQGSQPNLNKLEGVRIGNVIVLAQENLATLTHYKQRLRARSYQVHETPHFVVCQKFPSHQTVLMHLFGQAEIDADLIRILEEELSPFGLLASAREFNALLFAVLASTFPSPRNQAMIRRQYCLNTLARLRVLIARHLEEPLPLGSHITPFAAIYQQVLELFVGRNMLDVGCSFGYLPILMAEHAPNVAITACDNDPDAITCSHDLATTTGVRHISFTLSDVLSLAILEMGHFDTVTAIHLLEHLNDQDVPLALRHLLHLTTHRLLVAVPYERQATVAYGHEQIFTREKLERWGTWCMETLVEDGRYWCEDLAGGLLIIDRTP